MAIKQLPEGYDVDTHFKPALQPVGPAAVPGADGDLFKAIRDGRASVVTDRIETFTEHGMRLESGQRARGRHRGDRDRPAAARPRRHRS